jgi:stalled ribosome rescue protein Dom34
MFQQVSHNPFLMAEGIDIHPDALSLDELRQRAWLVFEPHYLAKLAALSDAFGHAQSKNLGQGNLAEVAVAVATGRVATLLIEADREILGRLDTATGEIEQDELATNDLLNDLGLLARQMGGEVVIIPPEQMPTQTGIAAIYRY